MKRLVLLGEGHGEVSALPILVKKVLREQGLPDLLFVDSQVIRRSPSKLVKWNKERGEVDYTTWLDTVRLASRRRDMGAILAVYDGDARTFPPGSALQFCAGRAAKEMAKAAASAGAGETFSLSVVFACSEYETWLVAAAESLAGRRLRDGRVALPSGVRFPSGNPESHGKRWLEEHCPYYRSRRDQSALTELIDVRCVRRKKLRSFQRFEHAVEQLLNSVTTGSHVSTPR